MKSRVAPAEALMMGSPVVVVGSEGGRANAGRPHWKGHEMPVAATMTPASGYRAVGFTSGRAALRGRRYLPEPSRAAGS